MELGIEPLKKSVPIRYIPFQSLEEEEEEEEGESKHDER